MFFKIECYGLLTYKLNHLLMPIPSRNGCPSKSVPAPVTTEQLGLLYIHPLHYFSE